MQCCVRCWDYNPVRYTVQTGRSALRQKLDKKCTGVGTHGCGEEKQIDDGNMQAVMVVNGDWMLAGCTESLKNNADWETQNHRIRFRDTGTRYRFKLQYTGITKLCAGWSK